MVAGYSPKKSFHRVFFLSLAAGILALAIIGKLFYLQVIKHNYYLAKAQEGHLGYTEIEPRRGDILIKDFHSDEVFRLATSTSFDLLFADPTLVEDPQMLTDILAPLLFNLDEEREKERKRLRLQRYEISENPSEVELASLQPKPEADLLNEYKLNILQKISQKTRQEITLVENPDEKTKNAIEKYTLPGIGIDGLALRAWPPQIRDPDYTARILAPIVDIPYERLSELLKGKNRYVVLHPKLPSEVSAKIKQMMEEEDKNAKKIFSGVGFQEKNYRFYPESELLAQVLGFANEQGGLYGIESRFNQQLAGQKGIFRSQLDASGRQVTVGNDLIITAPVDGDNITLTVDRSIQLEIERRLAKMVKDVNADSGLVIVMEPKTGRIISIAHYPTFDPNEYGKALETEDIVLTPDQLENQLVTKQDANGDEVNFLYLDFDSQYRIQLFKRTLENGRVIFEKFKNVLGSAVYLNRAVAEVFEPGSTFKVIAMAIAIDAGVVTPSTTYNDTGPIKVDEFEIHNATDVYFGITDMKTVIAKSLNTGMAFVTRKMGRDLFYRYMKRFGFGEKTDIEFDGELEGTVQDGSKWAESELVTYGFGQGIAVTPIQMVAAVSAIANKGVLMQPYIVDRMESEDGKTTITDPRSVRQVISEKAANTLSAMMVNAVENGVARRAQVKGYYIAGKTGTAQTYKHGKPLTGPGTTIASFVGFAPIDNPKFAVLVKIDRPRTTIWADGSAAPLFADIGEFLMKYYSIKPDK